MSASALYEGFVRHRRTGAVRNEFRHPLFMVYLDLDELPQLFDGAWAWSARRPAPAWFRRADHLGDPAVPLDSAVRALVAERCGVAVDGPIRLLTHLRYFGHCFNPVSFFYCFDAEGQRVAAVVAHVTNTPWGESHSYVMATEDGPADRGSVALLHSRLDKRLHVSPFMGMDHSYDWRLTEPSQQLLVHIDATRAGEKTFDATLSLRRVEISPASLRRALVRHPFMTLRVSALIYAHAARLRLRGARWFTHPGQAATT